ncbi:MAG: zf-HC2 domain-containing protein [Bacteroidota bacterium]
MNCITAKELVNEFLDNELSPELLQPLFAHLADCTECRKFLVQTKTVHDAAAAIRHIPAPAELDRKFNILGIQAEEVPAINRRIAVSIPSAILSGVLVFMISIVFFLALHTEGSQSTAQRLDSPMINAPQFSSPFPLNRQ